MVMGSTRSLNPAGAVMSYEASRLSNAPYHIVMESMSVPSQSKMAPEISAIQSLSQCCL